MKVPVTVPRGQAEHFWCWSAARQVPAAGGELHDGVSPLGVSP